MAPKRRNTGKNVAKAAKSNKKEPEKPVSAVQSKRPSRAASIPAVVTPKAGTKRKASPSPAPVAKRAASVKKGRTASPSPAPTNRAPARGRAASTKKEETKKEVSKPASRTPSRSSINQKGQGDAKPVRATRGAVEDVEKEQRGRSTSKAAKTPSTPKRTATPKGKTETPKQTTTPRQRSATPKSKLATPKQAATPKQRSRTPKGKAVTPKKKETPKQKTPASKQKTTPKQVTPKQKQTPKASPAAKKATPRSLPKKTPPKASPQQSSRSRRGVKEVDTNDDEKGAGDAEEKDESEEPIAIVEEVKQTTEPEPPVSETEETKEGVEETEKAEPTGDEEAITEEEEMDVDATVEEVEAKDVEAEGEEEPESKEETEQEVLDEETPENEDENVEEDQPEEEQTSQQVEAESAAVEEEVVKEVAEEVQAEAEVEEAEEETGEDVTEDQAESEQVESTEKECESAESEQADADVEPQEEKVEDNTEEAAVVDLNEAVVDLNENTGDSVEVISDSVEEEGNEVIELNEDSGEAVALEESPEEPVAEDSNPDEDIDTAEKATEDAVQEISDDDEDVEEIGLTPAPVVEVLDEEPSNIESSFTGIEEAQECVEGMDLDRDEEKAVTNLPNGATDECTSPRKRKIDEVEEADEEEKSPKKARLSVEGDNMENGSVSQDVEEVVDNEYVVVEMGDVPSPESQEVTESLPKEVVQNNVDQSEQDNPIFNRTFIPNPAISGEGDISKQFSLVSYNVLADCALFRNDYSFTDKEYLDPEYRLNKIVEELQYLDADVICLQEVDPQFFSEKLLPSLKSSGYEGFHKKRTTDFYNEGEATFYKTSRFTLVESSLCRIADLVEKELQAGIQPEIAAAIRKYMDLADVLVVTKLRCNNTGSEVTVGNIHVYWGEMQVPDAQCVQIASAIKEIVMKAGADNFPHILCGDFNSPPMSPGYLMAKDGYLNRDETITQLQKITGVDLDGEKSALVNLLWPAFQHTSSSLNSAYSTTLSSEPEITSFNRVMCECVDYVFYSSSSLDTVGVYQTPTKEKIMETGGTPNCYFPSDHVSLKAVLAFK